MNAIKLSWEQVLRGRLARQHLLERAGSADMLGVVRDLCGVHAQVMSSAELTLWARTEDLGPEAVQDALWKERSLVKTWAMRGTLHLLPADDLPLRHVAAIGTRRDYHQPAWQRYHGVTAEEMEAIIEAVPLALDGRCLTREELGREVARITGIPGLADRFGSGWGALLKPSASLGHLCFGPNRGRNVTFVHPDRWLGGRPDIIDAEEAEEEILRRYLRAYGPATHGDFARWWGVKPAEAREVFGRLSGELVEADVEGWKAWALEETLENPEEVGEVAPVLLLPGFDQYVVAAPRHPEDLLPAGLKERVFRAAGWISPVLLVDGRIRGVWRHERKGRRLDVRIEPFEKLPANIRSAAEVEAERLARYMGGELELSWSNP